MYISEDGVTEITFNQGTWLSGRKGTQVLALGLLRDRQCCVVAVGSSRASPELGMRQSSLTPLWWAGGSFGHREFPFVVALGSVWHRTVPCYGRSSPQINAHPWINFLEQFVHHKLHLGAFFPLGCPGCLALFCTHGFCLSLQPCCVLSPFSLQQSQAEVAVSHLACVSHLAWVGSPAGSLGRLWPGCCLPPLLMDHLEMGWAVGRKPGRISTFHGPQSPQPHPCCLAQAMRMSPPPQPL